MPPNRATTTTPYAKQRAKKGTHHANPAKSQLHYISGGGGGGDGPGNEAGTGAGGGGGKAKAAKAGGQRLLK